LTKSKISVGVIGCGYWGFNHVRLFGEHQKCSLKWCSDLDRKILSKIRDAYPQSNVTTKYMDVICDDKLDAVCISSPATTHFAIAKMAIKNGQHVLLEKPITTNSNSAKELVELARDRGVVLMPGHVYMFHPAVKTLHTLIRQKSIGDIYYINSIRTGFGPIRKDVNAMWDLAPHDIYTISNLMGDWPLSISASGASFIQEGVEDVVFLSMRFKNGVIANMHLSWINPTKTRLMAIVGSKKMVEFDDVAISEKVKLYDKTVKKEFLHPTYADFQLALVDGDIYVPRIPPEEPLKAECNYFLDSIFKSKIDKQLCKDGVFTISVLEAATKSLHNKSKHEEIEYPTLSI
jgi:predicted dehydrogenase